MDPKKAQDVLWASEGASVTVPVLAEAAAKLLEATKAGAPALSKAAMKRMSGELQLAADAMSHVRKVSKAGAGQLGGTGALYAHGRRLTYESQQSRAVEPVNQTTPAARPALADLTNFVVKVNSKEEAKAGIKKRAEKKRDRQKPSTLHDDFREATGSAVKREPEIVLPKPANGVKYLPSEAGSILAEVPHAKQAIKMMIAMDYTDLSSGRLYSIRPRRLNGDVVRDVLGRRLRMEAARWGRRRYHRRCCPPRSSGAWTLVCQPSAVPLA